MVYTSDNDQFGNDEFAQNADEVAATIQKSGVAHGDCEDSGVLLAVMYMAAGYRSAIAVMPGHVATLVYLPEYKKATRMPLSSQSPWANHENRDSVLGPADHPGYRGPPALISICFPIR